MSNPTEVIMPVLGMTQDYGKLVRWIKRAGDWVIKGEPLMEVETDKATVEIEAPASGFLTQVSAEEGDNVTSDTGHRDYSRLRAYEFRAWAGSFIRNLR